jgi:hypothetical protein
MSTPSKTDQSSVGRQWPTAENIREKLTVASGDWPEEETERRFLPGAPRGYNTKGLRPQTLANTLAVRHLRPKSQDASAALAVKGSEQTVAALCHLLHYLKIPRGAWNNWRSFLPTHDFYLGRAEGPQPAGLKHHLTLL